MAPDYDLVILGDRPGGLAAARMAAQCQARVALVAPSSVPNSLSYDPLTWLQAWREGCQPGQTWAEVRQCCQAVTQALWESPSALALAGVDVVVGQGRFCRQPHLGVVTGDRQLAGRTYLLATGYRPRLPTIKGLAATGYITFIDLPQQESLPERLVILGSDPIGIALAQFLVRWGVQVTLVIPGRLLPAEDEEMAYGIQTQLEAEGVQVYCRQGVSRVQTLEGEKLLQVGTEAIAADEILVAVGSEPDLETLNLAATGVKQCRGGVILNRKLQTSHPRIYGCGAVAGGYPWPHIARYEAGVVVKNVLGLPLFTVNYQALPWIIPTDPPLARVGLTEAQARRRYGQDVAVLRQSFQSLNRAQIQGVTVGCCKLVVGRGGKLLGAHIWGAEAGEMIGAVALAIAKGLEVRTLAQTCRLAPTFCEILGQTASQWRQQQLWSRPWTQDLLESFFNWRRGLTP